jgi:hypothetical protein
MRKSIIGWLSGIFVPAAAGSLVLCAVAAAPTGVMAQAQPEKLETPTSGGTFVVTTTYEDGTVGEVFNRSNPLYLNIDLVLSMNPTRTYPLTLTLIQDGEETPIWNGTLEEGFWRVRYPVPLTAGSGEVTAKVVMRVRMFKKNFTGESSYQYYTWEGGWRIGKIR